jgi:TrmH family RNA methyltransferase
VSILASDEHTEIHSFREQLIVVLVRARNPGNIGSVARAMHDFGFANLRVVNDFPVPFEAAKSAVDASEVMRTAGSYASVAEAVADCTLVVGTTAVGERDLRQELLQLPQAAQRIRAESAMDAGRVGLLFGSEKTGLSNAELSYCHWLLTIPMAKYPGMRHPSMNLGQAIAVCLWELGREAPQTGPEGLTPNRTTSADSAALERMTTLLIQVADATEYNRRHAANADPEQIRRLVRRIGVDSGDAPVWMGLLRQILWKLGRQPRE